MSFINARSSDPMRNTGVTGSLSGFSMTFLVFNADPIALLDIVGILRTAWPNSVVEPASTLADAKKLVERQAEVTGAFIGLPFAEIEKTGLSEMIESKDGKIILSHFGQDALEKEIERRGWVPLALPFTNESVKEALISAGLASR